MAMNPPAASLTRLSRMNSRRFAGATIAALALMVVADVASSEKAAGPASDDGTLLDIGKAAPLWISRRGSTPGTVGTGQGAAVGWTGQSHCSGNTLDRMETAPKVWSFLMAAHSYSTTASSSTAPGS